MKRVIVKGGKPAPVTDTPSGEVTPTQDVGEEYLESPKIAEENPTRSPGDLEKALSGSEDINDAVDEESKN